MAAAGLLLASCGGGNIRTDSGAPQEYPLMVVKPEDKSL